MCPLGLIRLDAADVMRSALHQLPNEFICLGLQGSHTMFTRRTATRKSVWYHSLQLASGVWLTGHTYAKAAAMEYLLCSDVWFSV